MTSIYFTVLREHFLFCVNFSWNFFHTILRPQATIWTKNPLNPAKIGAKTTPLFYKRRNKIVKPRSMNWSIKRWIVENGLAVILRQNQLHGTHSFQENTILVSQFGWYKILMAKIQCVLSHYCTSFHETIYKGTSTCGIWPRNSCECSKSTQLSLILQE